MANRSTLLKFETRFFFQPGQLGTQTPDLGIQFVEFLLMFSFPGTCALAILFEQLDEILQCQLFPFMDLVRMNMVLRSDLSDTLVFAQCFQDDLSLEASRYAFSFGHVLSPESTPQLCPFLCLNFLIHYSTHIDIIKAHCMVADDFQLRTGYIHYFTIDTI